MDWSIVEEDLKDLIEKTVGEGKIVKTRIGVDKYTNKPRGYAHVDFVDVGVAQEVIEKLNGVSLKGRQIVVNNGVRREDLPASSRDSSSSFDGNNAPRARVQQPRGDHVVFLGNLAWDMSEGLIKEMVNDILGPGLFTNVS